VESPDGASGPRRHASRGEWQRAQPRPDSSTPRATSAVVTSRGQEPDHVVVRAAFEDEQPWSAQAPISASQVSASGSRVARSLTSSTPTIRPRLERRRFDCLRHECRQGTVQLGAAFGCIGHQARLLDRPHDGDPAAQLTGLPPKVVPCAPTPIAPGARGGLRSRRSHAVGEGLGHADNVGHDVGVLEAHMRPVRAMPDWISSQMSRMPFSSQRVRSSRRNEAGAG